MRELAAESGLAKATIYHHFQDKGDIFRHVLERDLQMVHARLQKAVAETGKADVKIKAIMRAYFQMMRERRTIIMNVMRELGQQETNLCAFINENRDKYFAPIRTILAEGIAAGLFRELNVEHTAISMVGMINAFVVFRPFIEQEDADDAIIEQTIELFFNGIRR